MGLQMYYKIMKSANVFVRKCTIYTKYDYLCSPKTTNNMAVHNELGTWGEEVAAQYLTKKGYTIVERDWKSGHRDIDIIALKDDIVVFVEVKTRRNNYFGEPEDAVDFMITGNKSVSHTHASIVRGADGNYYLYDLESKNHTYLNGERLVSGRDYQLHNNDQIRLANEDFIFTE